MKLSAIDFDNLIKRLIETAELDDRSATIIDRRFGLNSPETATLQELGAKYGVTRERVRQLESQAINGVRGNIDSFGELKEIKGFVSEHLFSVGGLRKDDFLVNEILAVSNGSENPSVFGNYMRFVFKVLEYPKFSPENEENHDFWYSDEEAVTKMRAIVGKIIDDLKGVEYFDEILRLAIEPHSIAIPVALGYISVSKHIGVGPYGDIGLSHWEEINPKTVRAKAFLLLKRSTAPMHFTEIAKLIGSHAPTVHNELIKDPRFVLVGRGTYFLKVK